jgi:NADH dehydrogenase
VELSGAIAELAKHSLKRDFRHIDPTKAKVLLVEAGPNILPTYPPVLQAKAIQQLESLGVEVRRSAQVRAVDEFGAVVGKARIAARTVLWGAGVMGTPIARSLGVPLDRHGRVPVNERLNPPGLSNVFVIGDVAALLQDGHPVPGVATAAIQGGRYAARTIKRQLEGKPTEPFRYWNKGEIATIGRSRAVAMIPRGIKLSGFWAWVFYLTVHMFYLVGFRTRIRVFVSWIWSYLTWARGARLIPSTLPEGHRADESVEAKPPLAKAPEEHPPSPQPH